MKISEVKTAFKIADVRLIPNETKINFNYLKKLKDENNKILPQDILNKNVARVYLIVVNKIIKKIGGSQAEGGIKKTLEIYRDGGIKGRPSIRSFGIWYFLYSTLLKKHEIEFYMIYQPGVKAKIKGLFGLHEIKKASFSYKLLENCCINDYLNFNNGKYPEWNLQEQASDWPDEIKEKHADILKISLSRKKSKGRIQAHL